MKAERDAGRETDERTFAQHSDEMREMELMPEHQHLPGQDIEDMEKKTYKISFNQIYLSKPMVT